MTLPDLARTIAIAQHGTDAFWANYMPAAESLCRVEPLVAALRCIPDDERVEVFAEFCGHCGSDRPGCQCWNDE